MKIAILSRNAQSYSTRRLVEACKQRDYEVEVLDHLDCYVSLKKGEPTMYYHDKEITGVDAVIPRIGSSVTFYGTAIVRQFEMMKVFAANGSIAITRSRDKLRSMQWLCKEGLGMPATVFAHHAENINNIIKLVGGTPVVIKLLEGTQGIGVMLAETKKAAKSILETFHGLDKRVLIQEFIKEAGGADIRALVVGGQVVGAMKRQAEDGEFRSNLHRGGTAVPIKLTKEERQTAVKAAKAMGLNIAGVDMLQSSRGTLVIEVNSSPGLEGIEKATGKDIAGKIVEFAARKSKATKEFKRTDKVG
ncbi:MAG TPA: 30S ribosomal protein S6--L-glutamate ligase [Bacteroidia bacterium]|nr:30S ribosomal protein S6--L-glutamate ligase [Bacteroidia bacterium]